MRKHVWLVALVAAVVMLGFALAGCGGGTTTTTAAPGTDTTVAETSTTVAAIDFKAAMATDVGKLGDKSFNDGAWAGLQLAQSELGVESSYLVSEQQTDYIPNLTRLTQDGNKLVFAIGFFMTEAILEVARANPDTMYGGIDIDLADKDFKPFDEPNIREITFSEQQAGYLAGIVAANMTLDASLSDRLNADKVLGVVAGSKIPPVDRYIAGFVAAAKSVDPSIKVLLTYTDTFDDPNAGKEAAVPMFDGGADIVFQVAGKTGLGVFEAAKDAKRLAIGVDVDQYAELPEVMLTSAEKKITNAVFMTIKDAVDGKFTAGNVLYDLSNEGVGLAPYHDFDSVVPQSVKDAVEKAKADILAGTIKVPDTVDESLVNK